MPDTIFRLEAALDLEPGTLVPSWPEWRPIGLPTHGARSRQRRRELGLSMQVVAAAAGVSKATISRFEREACYAPSLCKAEIVEGVVEVVAITNTGYSTALGFSDCAAHDRYCLDPD